VLREWREINRSSFSVVAVDTTGAGDTFLGFLLAAIDSGVALETALKLSAAAAAIQITRDGAVRAIPLLKEVEAFASLSTYEVKRF